MDKVIQPCQPVVGAAFGQTATLDLTIGPRHHAIWLEVIVDAYSGVTLSTGLSSGRASAEVQCLDAIISMIAIKINGKVQRAHSAFELDSIQKSYGDCYSANAYDYAGDVIGYTAGAYKAPAAAAKTIYYIPIFFAEPWRKSYAATESMAWYTAWQDGSTVRSFQMEITVPARDTALLDAGITINAYAETDSALGPLDSNKKPVALITKWNRLAVPYTGTGDLYITSLPKRDVYLQISAFQATDSISAAKVKVDSRIVRDITKGRNDQTLIGRAMYEAALVEKRFDIVFDYSDLPTDGLVMQAGDKQVQDFQVILTMAAAAATSKIVSLVSQTFGGID
jgi:hypothetical protein